MGDRFLGDLAADGHRAWSSPFMDGETEAQRKGVIAPGSCGRLEAVSQFPRPWLLWSPHPLLIHYPVPELCSPGAEGSGRCFSFLERLMATPLGRGTVIHHGRLLVGGSLPTEAGTQKWEVLVIGEVQAWDGPPARFKCLPSSLGAVDGV